MIENAVILAATMSNHHSNLTNERPGAMLPALGKPMVVRVMDRLYRAGIRQYIVVVGLNEGAVASYLNKQWMPDAKVEFVLKSNETTGTIITRIAQKLNKPFMIAGYNTFTNERFIETMLREHSEKPTRLIIAGAQQSLSIQKHSYFGKVENGEIETITETKPEPPHVTLAEIIILGSNVIDHLKDIEDKDASQYGRNIFQFAQKYSTAKPEAAVAAETSWVLQIESDADLLNLNCRLMDDSSDSHILSELPYSVKVIPPVRIDPQVSVGQNAIIGPHVYIERGSSIGYGAKIRKALVLERGIVAADAHIDSSIITTSKTIDV